MYFEICQYTDNILLEYRNGAKSQNIMCIKHIKRNERVVPDVILTHWHAPRD
jgi:hypothetical protein